MPPQEFAGVQAIGVQAVGMHRQEAYVALAASASRRFWESSISLSFFQVPAWIC